MSRTLNAMDNLGLLSDIEYPEQHPDYILPTDILTKSEHIERAKIISDLLLEKNDALTSFVLLKQMQEIVTAAENIIKASATMQAGERESEGTKIIGSATIQTKRVRSYEYSHPRLNEIEAEKKVLANEEKTLREMLRAMKKPIIDETTGELISPATLTKDGITLQVTFKL